MIKRGYAAGGPVRGYAGGGKIYDEDGDEVFVPFHVRRAMATAQANKSNSPGIGIKPSIGPGPKKGINTLSPYTRGPGVLPPIGNVAPWNPISQLDVPDPPPPSVEDPLGSADPSDVITLPPPTPSAGSGAPPRAGVTGRGSPMDDYGRPTFSQDYMGDDPTVASTPSAPLSAVERAMRAHNLRLGTGGGSDMSGISMDGTRARDYTAPSIPRAQMKGAASYGLGANTSTRAMTYGEKLRRAEQFQKENPIEDFVTPELKKIIGDRKARIDRAERMGTSLAMGDAAFKLLEGNAAPGVGGLSGALANVGAAGRVGSAAYRASQDKIGARRDANDETRIQLVNAKQKLVTQRLQSVRDHQEGISTAEEAQYRRDQADRDYRVKVGEINQRSDIAQAGLDNSRFIAEAGFVDSAETRRVMEEGNNLDRRVAMMDMQRKSVAADQALRVEMVKMDLGHLTNEKKLEIQTYAAKSSFTRTWMEISAMPEGAEKERVTALFEKSLSARGGDLTTFATASAQLTAIKKNILASAPGSKIAAALQSDPGGPAWNAAQDELNQLAADQMGTMPAFRGYFGPLGLPAPRARNVRQDDSQGIRAALGK